MSVALPLYYTPCTHSTQHRGCGLRPQRMRMWYTKDMKREIKFRAWDSKTGIMFYDVQNLYDGVGVSPEEPNQPIYDSLLGTYSFGEVLSSKQPVMQYTGLCDKNGSEIFEGDILLYVTTKKEKHYWEVYFDTEHSGWFVRRSGSPIHRLNKALVNHTLIGNIYQNPELLT